MILGTVVGILTVSNLVSIEKTTMRENQNQKVCTRARKIVECYIVKENVKLILP